MNRDVLASLLGLAVAMAAILSATARAEEPGPTQPKMIGMYIHQHWPYNHPYATR